MDSTSKTKFNGFPLAFLKNKGHIQANGPLHCFRPFIDGINKDVRDQPGSKPLIAGSCQMYNLLSHRVRDRREHHDAQLGQVTAAIAGGNLAYKNLETKAAGFRELLESGYPHERFRDKIQTTVPKSLRVETNYTVDFDLLDEDFSDGGYVTKFIIKS